MKHTFEQMSKEKVECVMNKSKTREAKGKTDKGVGQLDSAGGIIKIKSKTKNKPKNETKKQTNQTKNKTKKEWKQR